MASRIGLFAFIVILATVAYGYNASRTLRLPPEIVVHSPVAGERVQPPVVVSGTVKDALEFFINDRKVRTDLKGKFSEVVTPPTGYTEIELFARDVHARERQIIIPLTVLPYANSQETDINKEE